MISLMDMRSKHPRVGRLVFAVLAAGILAITAVRVAESREVGPDDPFCRAINDPASGDEIVLRPGEYRGPCMIRRGGGADRPLVVRAKDPANRPQIVYEGDSANVFEVRSDHVVIEGLSFGPTQRNVDGIRIRANRDVSVIDCEFYRLGGIAVAANQSNLHGLRVSGNVIKGSNATAMYFGCHDGEACRLSGVVIERNRIDGVDASEKEVGYGIQVKLNSTAVIRDNLIRNTKGPGIMIYGARDLSLESLIERNFVTGSRTSSGIVIGGGPAIVRNNIAAFNSVGGVGLEDYGQRGLLRSIKIGFNSVYGNKGGGVTAPPPGKLEDTVLVANAGWSDGKKATFPEPQQGLTERDNLACARDCFIDPANGDFSPAADSVLRGRESSFNATWLPADDFFGHPRKSPPRIGAVESPGRVAGARSGQ